MNVIPRAKPFAWSYSKLKNFETCPKRHWHVDIARDFKEDEGEALLWGNEVHKHLAARLKNGTPLPAGMASYESWCAKIAAGGGKLLVEQKLAITREFAASEFFGKAAWYRGVADVLKIYDDVALAVDWKTGKILDDSVQLALMAQCVFAHYPEVLKVRTDFIWLKEGVNTRKDFDRADMPQLWRSLWPRLEQLEHAHNTTSYPPSPGRLCRMWCPVTSCPHHGISN